MAPIEAEEKRVINGQLSDQLEKVLVFVIVEYNC